MILLYGIGCFVAGIIATVIMVVAVYGPLIRKDARGYSFVRRDLAASFEDASDEAHGDRPNLPNGFLSHGEESTR